MSDSWISEPRHWPREDRVTRHSAPEFGPFFEEALPFPANVNDGRLATNYISAARMREILSAPGSPFAPVSAGEYARLERRAQELELERDRLVDQVAELQAAVADLVDRGPDPARLAEAVVRGLEEHRLMVTGKPGRPKQAAA